MKRLIIIIGLLIPCLLWPAQPFLSNRRGAFKAPAGGGPAYLLSWNAESGSEPAGWGHIGSGVNWNYTTTVLEGSKSLGILGTVDSAVTNVNFTAQTDLWVLFEFRVTALPGAVINGLGITDSSGNAICFTGLNSSGTFTVNIVGGGSATTVGTIAANTTYWVKMRFKPSASSAIASIEFSTTGTFTGSGNNFATRSDVKNVNPGGISLENYSSGNTWIFDHGRVYNSDLGNSGNWP